MSIAIMIDNAKNGEELLFYIPIATETVFKKYWLSAAQEFKLKWIPIFLTGILVTEEDFPEIISEFNLVKRWVDKQLIDSEIKAGLLARIDYIIKKLPDAFKQKDVKLYIG